MKKELTQQEKDLIPVVRDTWINRALEDCHKGIDEQKFEDGIAWLYERFLELDKPQIVYCDSVVDAAIKISLVKDLGKELSDFESSMLNHYQQGTLPFMKNVKDNLNLKSSYIGWSNFSWVAFYDYFTQIKVLDNEDFNNYKRLIESNVFDCFEFEKAVFAVRPPVKIVYNENKVLHNIEGPSITFGDGFECYHVNGFPMEKDLFDKLYNNTYTVDEFFKERNEEVKSAVVSFLESKDGNNGVYYFFKEYLSEVDTYVDKKSPEKLVGTTNSTNIGVYTLMKGSISGVDIAYVRCYCPSTDRMFFLGVDTSHTSAKDAIASLYQVPKVLADKVVSISRQGEKFSTVFDDKTMEGLANNEYTKDQLTDYVSISGDKYFELMDYEY